ncbi:putative UTP-glucose-1-phosphate uridylyltransferase 2 [Pavlovales sp. CCMP2436]|nr:putative UTP-glucose-1-phosphate uridylyltransferase 2 [Pavlovales sp. CCMP2436]
MAQADPSRVSTATMDEKWPAFETKMKAEGLNDSAIAAFKANYRVLVNDSAIASFTTNYGVSVAGASTMMIVESAIAPVESLLHMDKLSVKPNPALLKKTLMLKLNGGLGTGMGLDKAKSLLAVKDESTFLDLIAMQVGSMRAQYKSELAFMLMNSFATSADTLAHLAKYPDLGTGADLEFQQNKAPKVTASDLSPASWPKDAEHEWCPPGHGDLYPAMLGSGTLDRLLGQGFRYMFVSNSDNLGATMSLELLTHFASLGAPFMMEVAERTDADKKGGHLAKDAKTGGLLLRESAQCCKEDEAEFQNISKYKFFNTNNLWVDLVALKALFDANNGALPLPVITNSKTVDPRDKASTAVIQLETAMGSAISCFPGATAIVIPRSRFAPVKTTSDLLALRSDAYLLTADFRIELDPARKGVPPDVKLDGRYKFVDAMDTLGTVPSLIGCSELIIDVRAGSHPQGRCLVLQRDGQQGHHCRWNIRKH